MNFKLSLKVVGLVFFFQLIDIVNNSYVNC